MSQTVLRLFHAVNFVIIPLYNGSSETAVFGIYPLLKDNINVREGTSDGINEKDLKSPVMTGKNIIYAAQ